MSYFYGRAVTSFDNHAEKRSRRKHSKQRSAVSEFDLEPVHASRHHKKHSSNTRRQKAIEDNTLEPNDEPEQNISPKCKNRRHLHKEIERLVEENRLLSEKLDESADPRSKDILTEITEKDAHITKLRNKCHKLERNYNDTQSECERLNMLVEQRESEFSKLRQQNEEVTVILHNFEQEREGLVTMMEKLKSENWQLNEDTGLLKSVIYRLNVELENYLDKLRVSGQTAVFESQTLSNIDDISRVDEMKKMSESWGKVNVHALGPLLNAYQENLREKEELIKMYKQEIDTFSGNCKEIVHENDILNKEIDNFKAKCENYTEEIKTIEEDATIIKEKNDVLTKQVALQKQKLQEIHSIYEQKVESMSQDNNKLHKDYMVCKTELSNLRGKYEILNDGYDKLKNNTDKTMPVSVHAAAVDECKRLFEELKSQYESEKKKLNARIKLLEEIQPENEKQLITVTAERDQLKLQNKTLDKTLKRTRHKLEHFQSTVYSMQISRDSFKRQLSKTTAYCEELVLEQEKLLAEKDRLAALLREREKETEDIQYLGDNIAQRMGTLKSQLKSVQKGVKIQELSVDQMKMEHYRELQRLKQLMKQKEVVIRKLQKEKCTTQDNLELVWKAATTDDKKVKNALKNTKIYNV